MKKFLYHILSVIVLLIFALTTIMQFHHHDHSGNIYIHLTTLDDLVIGHSDDIIERCEHSHKEEANDSECSMHLGDYKASELSRVEDNIGTPLFLLDIIADEHQELKKESIHICIDAEYYKINYVNDIIKSVSLFRGPPFV